VALIFSWGQLPLAGRLFVWIFWNPPLVDAKYSALAQYLFPGAGLFRMMPAF
jgi:hypothetical protein